jgi:hypothetical protein
VSSEEEESSGDEEITQMNVNGDSLHKTPSKMALGNDKGCSSDLSPLPEETENWGEKETDEESDGQRADGTNMNINRDQDGSVQTKRDSNARKGKRSTPPTTDDKDSPESMPEDIDSDRDVADTGKDGGLRQSGRIQKTPLPAPKLKPRPRKKAQHKAKAKAKAK